MNYSNIDLDHYLEYIHEPIFENNVGGMQSPDMFTFYYTLAKIKPDVVIESGVLKGLSTRLIRKTLGPDVIIICLDPNSKQTLFKDPNPNTKYYVGNNFIDFKDIDLTPYHSKNILVFLDDHQNAAQRLLQIIEKDCIKHILLNDNYPVGAGSHFSIQHLIDGDDREIFDPDKKNQLPYSINVLPQIDLRRKEEILSYIYGYKIFPNVFTASVELYEGVFNTKGFMEKCYDLKYKIFWEDRNSYSFNTYISL